MRSLRRGSCDHVGQPSAWHQLCRYVAGSDPAHVCADAFVHWRRRLGDLRAANGRYVAMVRAPSRDRGQHRSLRQLYRRCAVAAGVAACDGDRGLAPHLSGRWDVLRTGDAAVHHCAATSASDRGDVRGGEYPLRAQSWRFAQRADGLALRCGSCLLRGDGDAAGPHRRLLRRPRLRAGARR